MKILYNIDGSISKLILGKFVQQNNNNVDKISVAINGNLDNNTIKKVEDIVSNVIGVDEKIYGPFKAQDLVVMPKINANVIVKNRKGRILSNII